MEISTDGAPSAWSQQLSLINTLPASNTSELSRHISSSQDLRGDTLLRALAEKQ